MGAWWIVNTDKPLEPTSSSVSPQTPDSEIATLESANPALPSELITHETPAPIDGTTRNAVSPLADSTIDAEPERAVEGPLPGDPADTTWAAANPSDEPEPARAEAAIYGTRIEAASYSYGTVAEAEALDRERERQGLAE
ncbi:MAG: hypothetical protein AAB353_02945, partial [Candidatus Hydrogenedentota bacterium]